MTILSPDGAVSVAIEDLQILAGSLPRRILAEPLEWAAMNKDILHATWRALNEKA